MLYKYEGCGAVLCGILSVSAAWLRFPKTGRNPYYAQLTVRDILSKGTG